MALTYICHICPTANEKLSEEMAFEIKITSPENGVGGKKKKKRKAKLYLAMVRKWEHASWGNFSL